MSRAWQQVLCLSLLQRWTQDWMFYKSSWVNEGFETKMVQLHIVHPKQQTSILIMPDPSQTSHCRALVSLFTFLYPPLTFSLSLISISIVFPSSITYNHHSSVPLCCMVGQNHLTTWPFHTESITSLQPLFIFIHKFTLPSHQSNQIFTHCLPPQFEVITGFHRHFFSLNIGLSSIRWFARKVWSTQREKSHSVSFFFIST